MERLSENSLGSDAQRFNFQDSSSTGSTWFTRCLSGKKLASIIGIVLTIMLLFAVWLMVIQKENQSLRMELMELKNETKPLKMLVRNLQEMKRMTFVHDCKHLRYHGITQSGKYFIDPDGPSSGPYRFSQPPLQVFCDFEKNYTVVPYDDEQDPTQMRRLISESRGSCWQDLTFDCKALTYNLNGLPKAWWLDRNGGSQYFFDGAFENTTSKSYCLNCTCVGNHGRIRSDWLLPITGFEYDQPGLGEIVIGDLTCSEDLDLQITGEVMTSRLKTLDDWKGTLQIRFEFKTHSVTNLTRSTTKENYYEDYEDYNDIIVNCIGFLRFEDFNIEYCSCSSNHNCRRGYHAGYLKFTTNFYGNNDADRASVQFQSFGLNETQHVEVILDSTGVIKIKVNSQTKHLVDNRIDEYVGIKIEPSTINSFAKIMNVRITE